MHVFGATVEVRPLQVSLLPGLLRSFYVFSFRATNPELLHKKDRGRPTEAVAELRSRAYGEAAVNDYLPGAEELDVDDAEAEQSGGDSDDDDRSEGWENVSDDDFEEEGDPNCSKVSWLAFLSSGSLLYCLNIFD
jgi:hypothetical protein